MFVDIFNLFNNQDADAAPGSAGRLRRSAYQDPIRFLDPRRFFFGFRVGF